MGDDVHVPGKTQEECRRLCEDHAECEAVVVDSKAALTNCWGKRAVSTSSAENGCQTQAPYVTIMMPSGARKKGPIGKCTVLGDPHVTPIDRKMIGSMPLEGGHSIKGLYMKPVDVLDAGEYTLVDSALVKIHVRTGFTRAYTAASSAIGVAMTGPILGGRTLAVAYVGPTPQTPSYLGWKATVDGREILTQTQYYASDDKLVRATLAKMSPAQIQAVCLRCRSTIGTASHAYWTYTIKLGADGDTEVWILPGADMGNVAISMRKITGQDGLCGNFDCKWKNDGANDLQKRGWLNPVDRNLSLFPLVLESPPGWDVRKGRSPKEVLDTCSNADKAPCQSIAVLPERDSCVFDHCMKAHAHVDEQQLFSVGWRETFLPWKASWTESHRVLQISAFAASVMGLLAVICISSVASTTHWRRDQVGSVSLIQRGHSDAYVLVSTEDV